MLHELLGDTQRLGFHYIYMLLNPEIISARDTSSSLSFIPSEPTYLNSVPALMSSWMVHPVSNLGQVDRRLFWEKS